MEITEEELNYGNFIELTCEMCGEAFLYLQTGSMLPKFCADCAKHRQFLRNKKQHANYLGTTRLSPSFSGDFEKEREIIEKERKKLKLWRKK